MANAYGLRDVDRARAVGPGTLFQAASISKPVSAVGMFRLVEQGRLDIDRDINPLQTAWKVPHWNLVTRPSHYAILSVTCPDLASTDSLAMFLRGTLLSLNSDGWRPANSPPVNPMAGEH